MKKILLLLVFVISANAVSAQSKAIKDLFSSKPEQQKEVSDPDSLGYLYYSQLFGFSLASKANTKLFDFIYDWLGTPYRFGGNTRNGIDCSRFVNKVYDAVYNTFLGGASSRDIYKNVRPVDKEDLKEGDFVFFKMGKKYISHIGVYLGNGKFAHSSSSKGVSISDLNDPYFKRYFFKGGRMQE
ncbi:C40 family peptidase [Solitalea lacus]|uniref:C40 family peptidase n=1 Tax=Solitalea lacus TaxID=2911172 RepID=UPI001EDB31C8|nr:C40 family peptidase [Solitalea lacus]UKJ08134.1 C40 family peptidase [Solitalea lacus]